MLLELNMMARLLCVLLITVLNTSMPVMRWEAELWLPGLSKSMLVPKPTLDNQWVTSVPMSKSFLRSFFMLVIGELCMWVSQAEDWCPQHPMKDAVFSAKVSTSQTQALVIMSGTPWPSHRETGTMTWWATGWAAAPPDNIWWVMFCLFLQLRNNKAKDVCLDQGPLENHTAILYPCHGWGPQVGAHL